MIADQRYGQCDFRLDGQPIADHASKPRRVNADGASQPQGQLPFPSCMLRGRASWPQPMHPLRPLRPFVSIAAIASIVSIVRSLHCPFIVHPCPSIAHPVIPPHHNARCSPGAILALNAHACSCPALPCTRMVLQLPPAPAFLPLSPIHCRPGRDRLSTPWIAHHLAWLCAWLYHIQPPTRRVQRFKSMLRLYRTTFRPSAAEL